MRFYKQRHKFYCCIDLHARKMYVCILDVEGKTRVHQNIDTDPQLFYDLIFPFLKYNIVVGVECMFSWYQASLRLRHDRLGADLCADHKIPFVLGHALYMRAIHGSETKDDKKDSYKMAALLKGGTFPLAYPYPAGTRDLPRRRTFFVNKEVRGTEMKLWICLIQNNDFHSILKETHNFITVPLSPLISSPSHCPPLISSPSHCPPIHPTPGDF